MYCKTQRCYSDLKSEWLVGILTYSMQIWMRMGRNGGIMYNKKSMFVPNKNHRSFGRR